MKKRKPVIVINMDGPQGNIFFIVLMALRALIKDGASKETKDEFLRNLKECHSYREAVDMIGEYVTIKKIVVEKKEGGGPM